MKYEQNKGFNFEFILPKMVATRYVSTSFLDCNDYSPPDIMEYHATTNIDMKRVLFKGTPLKTAELFETQSKSAFEYL